MIYLCTVGVGKHLCVTPTEWEEEDFENVCEYQYIDKPRVYYIVKQANEIVKWLEEHGYKPTSQGSWVPKHPEMLVFSRTMFVECGKDLSLVKKPKRFMKEWLKEEILC